MCFFTEFYQFVFLYFLCNWIPGLSNLKSSVILCWPHHLEHYHTEHRCPTGLCAQPAALHTADPRLHNQGRSKPHHQVCRWHISGRSHQQHDETHYREEVAQLAEWCSANNLSLNVSRQRRLWWTQEKLCWPPPTDHRQLDCGESQQH